MNSKAQGTIEYLVIIAIVVVISLVVVALVLGIFDNNSGQITGGSQQLNLSTQPLAVTSSLIGTGEDANGLLVLTNNTGDRIENITVILGDQSHPYYNTNLSSGSTKTLKLSELEVSCEEGETKTNQELKITYITRTGIEKTINYGIVSLDCTENINPTSTNSPTEENELIDPFIILNLLGAKYADPDSDPDFQLVVELKNSSLKDLELDKIILSYNDETFDANIRGCYVTVIEGQDPIRSLVVLNNESEYLLECDDDSKNEPIEINKNEEKLFYYSRGESIWQLAPIYPEEIPTTFTYDINIVYIEDGETKTQILEDQDIYWDDLGNYENLFDSEYLYMYYIQ